MINVIEQNETKKSIQDKRLFENRKHGDLGFPMKIYWNDFTTYVAESIPWHWHEEMEFAVVTEGKVEISVASNTWILEAGEGVFINVDTLHQMKPFGEKKAYMFTIVAHPSILGIEKGFLLSTKYVTPFTGNDGIKGQVFYPRKEWQQTILLNLQKMYETYTEKTYGYEYRLHNLLCEIWYVMIQNAWEQEREQISYKDVDEERIYQALEYIQAHYMEAMTLEDICNRLSISKSECCRCFKRCLKMTPFEYIMIHRISVASKLLEKTNQSITQIAMDTGFNSNSYFCKIFRKYMNGSPIEYRRKIRSENE